MKQWVLFLVLHLSGAYALAQTPILPENGGAGIPGPVAGSFGIYWQVEPGAISYEYVLTDNPQCFVGCPGDTRQQTVGSLGAVEFDLRDSVWYQWMVRAKFPDGDSTAWSVVSSFLTLTPELGAPLMVFPNPAVFEINLKIDWAVATNVKEVTAVMLDEWGRVVQPQSRLSNELPLARSRFNRSNTIRFRLEGMPGGRYFLKVIQQLDEGETESIIPFVKQ
ncbi:MAG: hypothetical protein AAGI38_06325 [Bacteroidota bacterium]